MKSRKLYEQALRSEQPLECLSAVVRQRAENGEPREALLAELERLRGTLRAEGRDQDEDVVLEVMDFLAGFCSPHVRI